MVSPAIMQCGYQRSAGAPVWEPNPFSSNIILWLPINRAVPGSAKSLVTFNQFRIMPSMWIQCVPLLQADPTDALHDAVWKLQREELCCKHGVIISPSIHSCYRQSLKPQCSRALNLTIQATIHSTRPSNQRVRDHRCLNKSYFIQPPANLPQTV